VAAGIGIGLLLPRITAGPSGASTRVAESLVAVGFGILGLTSLIYSLLFLVAQWAFSSLSPRLNLFRDDPIVWCTYGLAIGIFVFSLTAILGPLPCRGASARLGIVYSEQSVGIDRIALVWLISADFVVNAFREHQEGYNVRINGGDEA
jgi:hypothetical protein